jgi:hypothetical protein
VHTQWVASARELIATAEPEIREAAVRLCREVLALVEEDARSHTGAPIAPAPRRARRRK